MQTEKPSALETDDRFYLSQQLDYLRNTVFVFCLSSFILKLSKQCEAHNVQWFVPLQLTFLQKLQLQFAMPQNELVNFLSIVPIKGKYCLLYRTYLSNYWFYDPVM